MASEIDALISSVNKKAKAEILIKGSALLHQTWQRQSSGSLGLDVMLGGGWPLNAMNEIIGLEGSGKTTIALKTLAHQQALDPNHHTVWAASEEFDPAWAHTLGVDVSRMTFVVTNVMEEVYESVLQVMTERAADAVVIDSLPALVPLEEAEKAMNEITVSRGALLTNKLMRKAYGAMNRSRVEYDRPVFVLLVNQWRDRMVQYGDPRTTPGGKGKNYAFVTRVEVSRLEFIAYHGAKVGQTIKCRTIKNKTAPPQRETEFDFYFTDHLSFAAGDYDTAKEVFELGLANDVIAQKGAWYHFKGRKWQGKDAAWKAINTDPTLMRSLDTEVRAVLGIVAPSTSKRSSGTKRRQRVEV
jgi:recombination protein RecA